MFPRAGLDLGGAVYPMYQDMASRRRSFPHWDDKRAPPLDQMILCGMFYAGYADCVRCFYCGVGLKHWEVTDDVSVLNCRREEKVMMMVDRVTGRTEEMVTSDQATAVLLLQADPVDSKTVNSS
nr:hypothetical protein BaRGS_032129 [Batillaria attramentaria]